MKALRVVGLWVALVLGMASSAMAEGFALTEWSARGLGLASGMVGRADDVSAIAYNAAGITQLPGVQVMGGMGLIAPMGTLSLDTTYGKAETTTKPAVWAAPHAYASWQLNDSLWLGLGVFSRFGLGNSYDQNWTGRYNLYSVNLQTVSAVKLVDALKICRKVVEAFRIRLDRCGARQTEQCVCVAGVAGIQHAAGTVQIDHGSHGMTRHGNGLNLHAAEVEHVAVLNRQRLHCARRHNVFLFGHKRPLRLAAAHHKFVALVDVAMLVQKRNVRRVHIAFPVLKRCAGVIHMSVRQHKRNGQIGTFAYKRFQTAYACKAIDKQRFFTAFNQIAKLAAQTADLRNIVKNLSACKKLGQNKPSSVNLRLCRLFIKRLPSAPLSCVFLFYYTISLKKCL